MKRINNKGFTLIEILTVVIILGLIASITFPIVKNIIQENRKKGFIASLDGIVRSTKMYLSSNAVTHDTIIGYNDMKIKTENNKFISGVVKYKDGDILLNGFSDGQFCANGKFGDYNIEERKCNDIETTKVPEDECFEFDKETGTITRYNYSNLNCSNSIIIPEKIKGVYVKHIGESAFIRGVKFANYYILSTGKYKSTIFTDIIENIKNPLSKEVLRKALPNITSKKCYFKYYNYAFNEQKMDKIIFNNGSIYLYCNVSPDLDEDYKDYNGVVSVDFSYARELKTIDNYAFMNGNLQNINFGNLPKLQSIGRLAFDSSLLKGTIDMSGLTGLKEIKDYAFSKNMLSKVILPKNLSLIGNYSFQNAGIEDIEFSGTSLNTIGNYAFEYNNLKHVKFPNTLRTLGIKSFSHNNIDNLNLNDGLISIGESAFSQNSVTTLVIPDSVEEIGVSAFSSNKLKNISIGKSLSIIPESAFRYNLITSIDIPLTVSVIGPLSFSNNNLVTVKIASPTTTIQGGAFNRNYLPSENCIITSGTKLISYGCSRNQPFVIPDTITVLDSNSLQDLRLSSITLPNSIIKIGNNALTNALFDSSSTINIGQNVSLIDEGAFTCTDSNICKYRININRTSGSITNSPWGNKYAIINWVGSE